MKHCVYVCLLKTTYRIHLFNRLISEVIYIIKRHFALKRHMLLWTAAV